MTTCIVSRGLGLDLSDLLKLVSLKNNGMDRRLTSCRAQDGAVEDGGRGDGLRRARERSKICHGVREYKSISC